MCWDRVIEFEQEAAPQAVSKPAVKPPAPVCDPMPEAPQDVPVAVEA